jgi:hypothetical protein
VRPLSPGNVLAAEPRTSEKSLPVRFHCQCWSLKMMSDSRVRVVRASAHTR